jgi:23S rRNA pseudouridine955/2504/2580 synthase
MNKNPAFKDIIIQEDDDLIFINKPAFISSLDERDETSSSILKLAKKYNSELQLCHRLDKETSGIMVIAKYPEAYREMAMSFEARKVDKTYHAIVEGVLNVDAKPIKLPLGITKKGIAKVDVIDGKPAETIVTTLKMFGHFTLLACKPITGRLHQIRIHLASQNFPIVSDVTYGGHAPMLSRYKRNFKTSKFENEQTMMKRVALHAYALKFEFKGKTYEVQAPYPKEFEVFLKLIEKFDN